MTTRRCCTSLCQAALLPAVVRDKDALGGEVVHFVKAGLDTVALAYQPVPRMPVQADCAELRLAVRRDGIIRFELPAFQD